MMAVSPNRVAPPDPPVCAHAIDPLTNELLVAFVAYLDVLDADQMPLALRQSIGLARASIHSAVRSSSASDVRLLLDVLADIAFEARLQGARRPPEADLRLGSSLLDHKREQIIDLVANDES
jgi:hypothetical protein